MVGNLLLNGLGVGGITLDILVNFRQRFFLLLILGDKFGDCQVLYISRTISPLANSYTHTIEGQARQISVKLEQILLDGLTGGER